MGSFNTVFNAIRNRVTQDPDSIAVVFGQSCISYDELWKNIESVAAVLRHSGIKPGDRILISAPSSPFFIYSYFATHIVGGIATPIDPDLPKARIDHIIKQLNPALALKSDQIQSFTCDSVLVDQNFFDSKNGHIEHIESRSKSDLADITFTTGTSGNPKGVYLTHGNILAAARNINSVIKICSTDIEIIPIPLFHSFGLGRLRCCLIEGATVVLVNGFRMPGEIFAAIKKYQATGLVGVPAGFSILLGFGAKGLGMFSDQLKYIEIGSSSMSIDDKQQLCALLPNTKIHMHYGLTEASRSAFLEFHEHYEVLESIGKPAPGVCIEIRDENQKPCGSGRPGTLWISGAHVSIGYMGGSEKNSEAFSDGWIRTGDTGYIDKEGFIYLRGREDDLIKVGGFKVSPIEIETILTSHPDVTEAACIGISDSGHSAEVKIIAFVIGTSTDYSITEDELTDLAKLHLERYKVPVEYRWVESFPKTESGKLLRRELRESRNHNSQ